MSTHPAVPAAVVLAAGTSSRFGSSKQLATWSGESLVRRTTRLALALPADPVIVVLGAEREAVAREVEDLASVAVENTAFESGQASSVRTGLAATLRLRPDACGCLFLPIDQPRINQTILRRLVSQWQLSPERVVQPIADGRPTSPTIFPRRLFGRLAAIEGDRGGAQLLGSGPGREEPLRVPFNGVQAELLVDYDRAEHLEAAQDAEH